MFSSNITSNTGQSQPREQTFLRVKRRRNENPPSTIRLELLGGWNVRRQDENDDNSNLAENTAATNSNNNNGGATNSGSGQHAYPLRSSSTGTLADSRHSAMSTSSSLTQSASNVTTTRRTTAAAVWKRVEQTQQEQFSTVKEKRCRVVDAIFESDGPSTKRRKLTVLGEADTTSSATTDPQQKALAKKKNITYKVLDPSTRLVDDSLTMVHAGDRSIADHYRFVTTDPRLAIHARTWLVYRNRGGNLLHACAHWNDVELAHDLLRQSLSGLADAVDEDGRTPYEAAQMCNHDSVAQVLEAFGADTTNFVYDMFVPEEIEVETTTMTTTTTEPQEEWNPLEKTAIHTNTNPTPSDNNNAAKGAAATSSSTSPPDMAYMDPSRLLELQGGVGYWTEEGELVLEMDHSAMMGVTSELGHQDEEDYEEDIDSNCEDYGANDYPDEESWEEEFLHEEPLIEDDSYGHGPTSEEYDMW